MGKKGKVWTHKCTYGQYEELCFCCPWCYTKENKHGEEEYVCENNPDFAGWNNCKLNPKNK